MEFIGASTLAVDRTKFADSGVVQSRFPSPIESAGCRIQLRGLANHRVLRQALFVDVSIDDLADYIFGDMLTPWLDGDLSSPWLEDWFRLRPAACTASRQLPKYRMAAPDSRQSSRETTLDKANPCWCRAAISWSTSSCDQRRWAAPGRRR